MLNINIRKNTHLTFLCKNKNNAIAIQMQGTPMVDAKRNY